MKLCKNIEELEGFIWKFEIRTAILGRGSLTSFLFSCFSGGVVWSPGKLLKVSHFFGSLFSSSKSRQRVETSCQWNNLHLFPLLNLHICFKRDLFHAYNSTQSPPSVYIITFELPRTILTRSLQLVTMIPPNC